jgi:hypothetical protein
MDTGKHVRENKINMHMFVTHKSSSAAIQSHLDSCICYKSKQQGQREGTWKTRVEACLVCDREYPQHSTESAYI